MNVNNLTFTDLFEELKLEIFKYLNLNDRIRCTFVSKEWSSLINHQLSNLQKTLVIGQPAFDSTARMKLSLCNINSRHIATLFNTVDTSGLIRNNADGDGDGDVVLSQLLKTCKTLTAVFIYSPVKIKLSDLPDTIEHIHFGHNAENVITFDKINFRKLTCISTIDAHLDELYLDGIANLLRVQKLQFENVSVCEVPRLLCEQIIEMRNLKQLYVFDFRSDFDGLYKEKNLEIMEAHPNLQYFNMFSYFGPEIVCPTDNIKWLVEFGSQSKPLDKKFIVDVFEVFPFGRTLQFAKDYVHGLHLTFQHTFETRQYETKLNALEYLRLTCHAWPISTASLQLSLEHIFGIAPNLRNLQLRFFNQEIFQNDECMTLILSAVSAFARKNLSRSIVFELSALGSKPYDSVPDLDFPKNLNVMFNLLK